MTLPATQPDQLPLSPKSVDEVRKPLGRLFAGYPEPWSDKTASHAKELIEAKTGAYILAVQGLPGWAVDKAVTDFIQGRVQRRKRGVLPTAEEIAVQARQHLEEERARQLAAQRRADQIREAEEWRKKQEWLRTPEGQAHQQERKRKAAQILANAGLRPMPSEE